MDSIRQLTRALLLAIPVLVVAGCVSPVDRSVPEERLRESGAYALVPGLEVPEVRGAEGCGAQALATMMAYRAPGLDPAAMAEALPWHERGANPVEVLLAARERGFSAGIERGSIEALAARLEWREPFLVMFDAAPAVRTLTGTIPTIRVMHWSVVSGIAHDGSRVLLAARDGRHHVVRRGDFLERWERSDFCTVTIGAPGEEGSVSVQRHEPVLPAGLPGEQRRSGREAITGHDTAGSGASGR